MCTNEFKSTKAITLIALVITIVVLLILARSSIITCGRRKWNNREGCEGRKNS